MQVKRQLVSAFIAFIFLSISLAVSGQQVIATIPVGANPYRVAVNRATNKIYVTNQSCTSFPCPGPGTVTVIDGATGATHTVTVGVDPYNVAVNPKTNKIYVANNCGNDLTCASHGTVTVIDGATNNTTSVDAGFRSRAISVNPVTNEIYVVNRCGLNPCHGFSQGSITVIDGATLLTRNVVVGVNPITAVPDSDRHRVYVYNYCGNDTGCGSLGTMTVIDGNTLLTQTVGVGAYPDGIAVNSVTNEIYVTNSCGNDLTCGSLGTVTIIDGHSLGTQTVNVGAVPGGPGLNAVTNQIYVVTCGNDLTCSSPGTVSILDGETNSIVATVPVGTGPGGATVEPVSNKTYVPNYNDNTVTMIDGVTDSTVTVPVGNAPLYDAINSANNRIYVVNMGDNSVSVIAGANVAPTQFVPITPCRLVDTRPQYGGDGPLEGGTSGTGDLRGAAQEKGCADLSSAVAYSLNIAVVPHGSLGYFTVWPTGEDQPVVATLNSLDGRIKANAAIVPAGYRGAINGYVTDTTDIIIDIDGYFAPPGSSTLAFYPMTPCRVADTRKDTFPPGLGTPNLSSKVARDFPVLASNCPIPATAKAYSLNLAAVPYPSLGVPLGYLEVWPKGQMPASPVSTLNNLTGTVVANAAIVPAGTGGEITVLPGGNTDLVIDINGYFAPAGTGGMSLYPAAPCRVIDTRKIGSGQPFSGPLNPPVDVVDSPCSPPSTAQAYVFNATVVPTGFLGYLTLWQNDPMHQPVVSTLNALDGAITNNMAIVPTTDGKIDAYASGTTQLILDLSSYFAP